MQAYSPHIKMLPPSAGRFLSEVPCRQSGGQRSTREAEGRRIQGAVVSTGFWQSRGRAEQAGSRDEGMRLAVHAVVGMSWRVGREVKGVHAEP